MIERDALAEHLATLLAIDDFQDYCPNGLQVEGRDQIRRLATAVSASQAVVDQAIAWGADALLVHHGYFWKNEPRPVTGLRRRRLKALLGADVSLLAYHLPLDAHPELGNNAQWAQAMGWEVSGHFGHYGLGCWGTLPEARAPEALAEHLEAVLGRRPLLLAGDGRPVRRLAWCSGGAQGWFEEAIEAGADAFVTGEASEPCYHLARESGVHFFAAGHHATERFGVRALGRHLEEAFAVQWRFFDEANPV